MILLKHKKDCCGCAACVQKCPKQCIDLKEDTEGFLYPEVNQSGCVDCGICIKVCPIINQNDKRTPRKVYAAKNKDEKIRLQSSSGGVFTLLAEKILEEKGVVFGARFDENWEVIHHFTESIEGLSPFRGSKYVQSRIGDTYKQAETFLKQGRKVMFTGTPCQIAGLKSYLRKEYEKLLTVDFVCHGVPSPKIWKMFLNEVGKGRKVSAISFRDKPEGWKKFSFTINYTDGSYDTEPFYNCLYMKGFLANIYLRPSCYCCPSKCFKSGSDITIGDFWGIQNILPEFDDDKGISLVIINNSKGKYHCSKIINSLWIECSYKEAYKGNPPIEKSVILPNKRRIFYHEPSMENLNKILKEALHITFIKNLKRIVRKIIQ